MGGSLNYLFGPYELDTDNYVLKSQGEAVSIEPQVFSLLQFLIENRDRLVTKDELIDALWEGRIVSDAAITSTINLARRAVADDGKKQAVIKTFPRRGFRFVAEIDEPGETRISPARSAEIVDTLRQPAVAVLPFDNMSNDPEQEYFSDGIAEDIITSLSLWRSFPVIARNSTFAYKGQSPDVRIVAKELGARYIVEGSVRISGSRVRVTAQLINAETGHHLWAERYDRMLEDVFDLQDELTGKIAAIVAPELERAEVNRLSATKPQNLVAWEWVQRGSAQLEEYSLQGNARAREMFASAIALDPSYSRAYSGISLSHNRDLFMDYSDPVEAAKAETLEYARKAVTHDRSDSLAHSVLGMALMWAGQPAEGKLSFERAVELNPSNGYAVASLGSVYDLAGNKDEGISLMEAGLSLNPNAPNVSHIYSFLARAYITAKNYDRAIATLTKGISLRPDIPNAHYLMAVSLAYLDRLDEAAKALEKCEEIQPGFVAGRTEWRPYPTTEENDHILAGLKRIG